MLFYTPYWTTFELPSIDMKVASVGVLDQMVAGLSSGASGEAGAVRCRWVTFRADVAARIGFALAMGMCSLIAGSRRRCLQMAETPHSSRRMTSDRSERPGTRDGRTK
jgi:hypothetical protein